MRRMVLLQFSGLWDNKKGENETTYRNEKTYYFNDYQFNITSLAKNIINKYLTSNCRLYYNV